MIKKKKKTASLSDVRDKLSVSCSMNSKLKAGSLGAYLLMCRLSAGPLKGLMVHADTGGKSMYGPPLVMCPALANAKRINQMLKHL